MALRDTFLNMLGVSAPEVPKTDNSVFKSARDFLRYGNREKLYPDWSDVKMPDSDMYRGYSYAVIQKRSNKVATLAKNNLSTWANPEVVDAFQDKDETVLHPYLKLIEDSTEFSEKQFWKNISIYLDLAGRYYLGVIRNQIVPSNPNLPVITTDATRFVLLNPYEIRRVIDKDKNVAGYIERKKDGRYREWPKHQIIEMRELNPFDPENSQWAMTDAAKEAVYTINQSSDYTRQSLHGNIEAPGIITTDVLLNDQDFANFRARVTQHQKGEPLFGNGTGAIKWDAMQIDLDKAALMDINEINRTTLFAVSGTSKTSLGIEQSGTTRETARVQSEQFIADTAQPRLEDIVDFLNLDYKKNYFNEYKKTGYYIEVKSAVGRDYDTEQKATALKQSQFQLAMQLMQAGYTEQSAYQFAEGEIDFDDLELEKGLDKPQNPENPSEGEASNENSPNSPNNGPQSGSGAGDNNNTTSEQNSLETAENDVQDKDVLNTDLNELEPHSELVENKTSEDENSLPFAHSHDGCTCEHDHKVEHFINEIQPEEGKEVKEAYDEFLTEIRALEKETINAVARKLTTNAFDESDIIGKRKKATITDKIKNAIRKYWWLLLPLFANNGMSKRNKEFGENIIFTFDNALQNKVINNADRVAKGHMDTILNDILEASNKVYTDILEGAAADLVVTAYRDNPEKFSAYFDHEPTRADALASIRKTDLLEQNRRIYDRANKMAFEGYERGKIVKAVRAEYKDISENRATLIARNETARAFGKSQFEADRQFLNAVGKLGQAYKIWYSRRPAGEQDKICPFCRELIEQSNINPVPFDKPFVEYGNSLEVIEDGKVKIFTADYEDIEGGTLHPNCYARDTQVYTNEGWKRVDELTGKELFWSIDPETKKPEWVKAKAKIEGYAETLLRFQNKNFDMAVTKDHNMYVESRHRRRKEKRFYSPQLKEAQTLISTDRFYGGAVWEGKEPKTMKMGDYEVPTELYCKFMGYYLSEGCANYYDYKKEYQGSIGQYKYHDKFWNDLEKMPFRIWNGETDFTFTDKSIVKYCMQFGKSFEKYIPEELKGLSPRLLKIFIDAFVLGDGSKKYSTYSNAWDVMMFTSSTRLRDDLTEVIQKAGYRPTVKLVSPKGTPYKGTNYISNHDVWKISMNNRLHTIKQNTKVEEIEYHDNVYCVELEKNHTLWVMYNGKCWWSGNCSCGYKLVFKNAQGEFVKTLNGGSGSGNFGHSGRPGQVGGSGKDGGILDEKGHGVVKNEEALRREWNSFDDGVLMSEDTKKMLKTYYFGSWYFNNIQKVAREKYLDTMDQSEKAKANEVKDVLDDLIESSELDKDLTLYRGITMRDENVDQIKNGSVITDKGFASTSLNPAETTRMRGMPTTGGKRNIIVLKINVKAGSKGLKSPVSADNSEYEVVLPRNAKFKVKSISQWKDFYKSDFDKQYDNKRARVVEVDYE